MCDTQVETIKSLVPSQCLRKHGCAAHKICVECWFRPTGFAMEGISHKCPGCIKKLPLTAVQETVTIDLTE